MELIIKSDERIQEVLQEMNISQAELKRKIRRYQNLLYEFDWSKEHIERNKKKTYEVFNEIFFKLIERDMIVHSWKRPRLGIWVIIGKNNENTKNFIKEQMSDDQERIHACFVESFNQTKGSSDKDYIFYCAYSTTDKHELEDYVDEIHKSDKYHDRILAFNKEDFQIQDLAPLGFYLDLIDGTILIEEDYEDF